MSKVKKELKRAGRRVEKEVKRTGRRIEKEVGRTRPEDILSMGATAVAREPLKKTAQELTNAVGTLTGTRQLQQQMRAQAAQQQGLIAVQQAEDAKAERRRRSMLRATLRERPNLFSVLGSPQGGL